MSKCRNDASAVILVIFSGAAELKPALMVSSETWSNLIRDSLTETLGDADAICEVAYSQVSS